jgi:hypothetical protein
MPSASPTAAEMPKSTSLTPPEVTITLLGLTSRCTTPRACAAASAAATWAQISAAERHGSAPPARMSASERPSTSSITTYGRWSGVSP